MCQKSHGRLERLVWAVLICCALFGCDHRGAYERQADAEIERVKADPNMSQHDKDTTILFDSALKSQAKQLDKQVAALSPEQRDAMERIQRSQSAGAPVPGSQVPAQQDTDAYVLSTFSEPSLYLGMNYVALNRGNARMAGISFGSGIYVAEVIANGPAAHAGLDKGDIIDWADGAVLNATYGIGEVLYQHAHGNARQGQPVTFRVLRGGKWYRVEVTPTSR